jgi:hypothetical protein
VYMQRVADSKGSNEQQAKSANFSIIPSVLGFYKINLI